jgi:hypothetical protein
MFLLMLSGYLHHFQGVPSAKRAFMWMFTIVTLEVTWMLGGAFLTSGKMKKMVLRTIRLPKDIDDALEQDADENGISVNSLINKTLKKYVEWDRHADRFGFISIDAETFRSILNEVEDKNLESIATTLGDTLPKSHVLFWFKKISIETILKTFSLLGKYSGGFVTEIDFREGDCVVTLRHQLGQKWSVFLRYLLIQSFRSSLPGSPQTEIADDLTVITFRMDLMKSKDRNGL